MPKKTFWFCFVVLLSCCVCSELDSNAPWPTLRGDQGRTGVSPIMFKASQAEIKWFHSLGRGKGQWSTFVAVDSNENIFVCGDGVDPHTYEFFAYNTKGTQLWSYSYQTEYYNPGMCGNAIIGTENEVFWNVPAEAMFCFNSQTGEVNWSQIGIHGILNVDSLLSGGLLYAFNYATIQTKQTLHGLNTTNGDIVYNSTQISPIGGVISMSTDNTLYMAGCGYTLATKLDGTHYYRTSIAFGCFSHLAINSTTKAAFGIGEFVRTDFGTKLFAFAFDGSIMWNVSLSKRSTSEGTSAALSNGNVIATAPNLIAAFDQETGEQIWKTEIPNANSSAVVDVGSPLVDSTGQIFCIVGNEKTQQATVWGFDGTDGSKIYESTNIGCSTVDIGSALALVSETSFVVVCRDTVVYFST